LLALFAAGAHGWRRFLFMTAHEQQRRREWRKANRPRLREYLREYRRKNHAVLELKRKCKSAGVSL
jgi:hypothetical protein